MEPGQDFQDLGRGRPSRVSLANAIVAHFQQRRMSGQDSAQTHTPATVVIS